MVHLVVHLVYQPKTVRLFCRIDCWSQNVQPANQPVWKQACLASSSAQKCFYYTDVSPHTTPPTLTPTPSPNGRASPEHVILTLAGGAAVRSSLECRRAALPSSEWMLSARLLLGLMQLIPDQAEPRPEPEDGVPPASLQGLLLTHLSEAPPDLSRTEMFLHHSAQF